MEAWRASTAVVGTPWLVRQMFLDGLYYYAYNEVAFITLNQVRSSASIRCDQVAGPMGLGSASVSEAYRGVLGSAQ